MDQPTEAHQPVGKRLPPRHAKQKANVKIDECVHELDTPNQKWFGLDGQTCDGEYRCPSDSEDSDDSDSDSFTDDEDSGETRRGGSGASGLSQAQINAQQAAAEHGLEITVDEFKDFCRGLRFISKALAKRGLINQRLMYVLKKTMPHITFQPQVFQQVVQCVTLVSDSVNLPKQEAIRVFAHLMQEHGGYVTQCMHNLDFVFQVAIFAKAAEKMDECLKTGTDQMRSMQAILLHLGLHGGAQFDIAREHVTETPRECMQNEANRVVAVFNAMPEKERLSTILNSVSCFGQGAVHDYMVRVTGRKKIRADFFDQKKPKWQFQTAKTLNNLALNVNVLCSERAFYENGMVTELNAPPFGFFPDALGGFKTIAYTHTSLTNPTREKVCEALKEILMHLPANADVEDRNPNLRKVLAAARKMRNQPPLQQGADCFLFEQVPAGTAIAVKYRTPSQRIAKFHTAGSEKHGRGKRGSVRLHNFRSYDWVKTRSRFCEIFNNLEDLQNAKWFFGSDFVELGGKIDVYIALPPKDGKWEGRPSDMMSKAVIHEHIRDWIALDKRIELEKQCREERPKNKRLRKLTEEEEQKVAEELEAYKQEQAIFADDWDPLLIPVTKESKKPSSEFKAGSKATAEAVSETQKFVDGMKGGKDYKAAASNFGCAAAGPSGASEEADGYSSGSDGDDSDGDMD